MRNPLANTHFVKLEIDLFEILIVLDQLYDQCSIGKSEDFAILDVT